MVLRWVAAALVVPASGAATALGFHLGGPLASLLAFLLAVGLCALLALPSSARAAGRGAMVALGYAVRPFDVVADRRRWRWQRTAPCGRQVFAQLPPDERAALTEAVREQLRRGSS